MTADNPPDAEGVIPHGMALPPTDGRADFGDDRNGEGAGRADRAALSEVAEGPRPGGARPEGQARDSPEVEGGAESDQFPNHPLAPEALVPEALAFEAMAPEAVALEAVASGPIAPEPPDSETLTRKTPPPKTPASKTPAPKTLAPETPPPETPAGETPAPEPSIADLARSELVRVAQERADAVLLLGSVRRTLSRMLGDYVAAAPPEDAREILAKQSELETALRRAFEVEKRYHEQTRRAGIGVEESIDFSALRREIGRRLDRLRAVSGAG